MVRFTALSMLAMAYSSWAADAVAVLYAATAVSADGVSVTLMASPWATFVNSPGSYLVTVTYFLGAGVRTVGPLTENIGNLILNVDAQTRIRE